MATKHTYDVCKWASLGNCQWIKPTHHLLLWEVVKIKYLASLVFPIVEKTKDFRKHCNDIVEWYNLGERQNLAADGLVGHRDFLGVPTKAEKESTSVMMRKIIPYIPRHELISVPRCNRNWIHD
jgi:hypothetical protein